MEQPIYDAVVREHGFDPTALTRFDLAAFLAAHKRPRKVAKVSRPRKAAGRARRT